jgi:hypothetical protein
MGEDHVVGRLGGPPSAFVGGYIIKLKSNILFYTNR